MALPADVWLGDVESPDSKPLIPARSRIAPSPGQGRCHPARIAADGSRWCAYCDWTLDPDRKQKRCEQCRVYRDRIRHRPIAHAFVSLPVELLDGLIKATSTTASALLLIDGRLALNQEPYGHELHALSSAFAELHGIAALVQEYTGR